MSFLSKFFDEGVKLNREEKEELENIRKDAFMEKAKELMEELGENEAIKRWGRE